MKKLLCFMLLAGAALSLPAKKTLAQAVASAWAIDPALDSQKLEEEAAAIAGETALRQKYFSVQFGGAYRYSSDKVQVRMSDFPFSLGASVPPGTIILSAPSDTVDLKLSLLQPLYSGGLLSNAVKMEAARGAAEKYLTRLKRIELAGRVKASFFTHRLYGSKRDALNFLLARLELHLQKVTNLYAEEQVKRSDLLETRARADEARLSLQDVEQLLASEATQFKSLSGYDPEEIDYQPGTDSDDFAASWQEFLAGHPLLRSLDERARLVQLQKRAVAAAYLPQASVFAEMHYGRPGQNFFVDRWTFYVQGGVSVSLPVFNWNRRGRDLELVDIAGRKLENQRAAFLRESEKNLRQLYLSKESLERKLALLAGLSANAAEDVRLKEQLYEENQIDHTDLLAAMSSQERYLANRGEALAQMEMLRAAIATLVGRTEEE